MWNVVNELNGRRQIVRNMEVTIVGGCINPLRTAIKPINSVPMNSRTSCNTKSSERFVNVHKSLQNN
ncbi:MAG: hypothetical protein ACTS6H_00535 [Candidatus Hodgkinia cicadicola]